MAGADKLPNMPPAKNPFPGSLTPGWNDPPPLHSSDTTSTSVRPRLNLKQRVAFPLDGLNSNNGSSNSSTTATATATANNASSSALTYTPGNANQIGGPSGATTSTLSSPPPSTQQLSKPIAKVPPQCASVPAQSATGSHALPPLPPLPPKADASTWPVATVHPRQK